MTNKVFAIYTTGFYIYLYILHERYIYIINISISGISSIGDYAFVGCNNVAIISIPESVNTLGIGIFKSCSKLENVILSTKITILSKNLFVFRKT